MEFPSRAGIAVSRSDPPPRRRSHRCPDRKPAATSLRRYLPRTQTLPGQAHGCGQHHRRQFFEHCNQPSFLFLYVLRTSEQFDSALTPRAPGQASGFHGDRFLNGIPCAAGIHLRSHFESHRSCPFRSLHSGSWSIWHCWELADIVLISSRPINFF